VTKVYSVFGGLVLVALSWIHFTGWSPSDVTEKKTPPSVRDNPGSYRSAYGGARPYTGAK
jgi:hypothetical protein